jgi:hypothetical protein
MVVFWYFLRQAEPTIDSPPIQYRLWGTAITHMLNIVNDPPTPKFLTHPVQTEYNLRDSVRPTFAWHGKGREVASLAIA